LKPIFSVKELENLEIAMTDEEEKLFIQMVAEEAQEKEFMLDCSKVIELEEAAAIVRKNITALTSVAGKSLFVD
jgi:hypothetical protein